MGGGKGHSWVLQVSLPNSRKGLIRQIAAIFHLCFHSRSVFPSSTIILLENRHSLLWGHISIIDADLR